MTPTARCAALALVLAAPALAPAQTYWLGRQPDPDADEYVFDVPVPAGFAAKLLCTDARGARFKGGVAEFRWEAGGKTHTFVQTDVAWNGDRIDSGAFAYLRNGAVDEDAWTRADPKAPGFAAVRDSLVAQKKPWTEGWFRASPVLLRTEGRDNPKLAVNFGTGAPFAVARHPQEYDTSVGWTAATKKPQIVAAVRDDALFVAYQAWGRTKPADTVVVTKLPLADVAKKKLSPVRQVPSGGTLVGFAVDEKGRDYVLTAKAEEFPNRPKGDFVDAVAKTWRKDVLVLHTEGTSTDLNSDKYTRETVYGVGNAGSGRLAAGAGHLAAVFARRHYSARDNLVHQEANVALFAADLSKVPLRAENAVSHSFDQRLVFDGTDFVSLHQGDQYPVTGLIVEKVLVNAPKGRPVARHLAFSCPTSGNAVFFELGGLAAEPDGYPVLFAATRNTDAVTAEEVEAKGKLPWDLAMVYVRRDFHAARTPKNPFDVVGSGVLADGYAKAETFTFDNLTWDPAAASFSKRETRTVTRRVSWLTNYTGAKGSATRATAPKLVQLEVGRYFAVWEEHALTPRGWEYRRTLAATVAVSGGPDDKAIETGKPAALAGNPRLHRGDDAFALSLGGKRVAAWVTAGETNHQLALHTVGEDLKHEVTALALP